MAAHRNLALAPTKLRSEGNDMEVARLLISRYIVLIAIVFSALGGQFASAQGAGTAPARDITPTEAEPAANTSPLGWIKMPTITMPKVTMPKITMPKMPADPLAPFRTSAKKVGDGAKKAWEGTKELFTFGGAKEPAARVASNGEAPSAMQRLFGGGAKEEPVEQGPRTIGEWMSQPRVDQ
jgi:hypothetical protein